VEERNGSKPLLKASRLSFRIALGVCLPLVVSLIGGFFVFGFTYALRLFFGPAAGGETPLSDLLLIAWIYGLAFWTSFLGAAYLAVDLVVLLLAWKGTRFKSKESVYLGFCSLLLILFAVMSACWWGAADKIDL
jgi:hypothetical protein